MGNNYSQAIIGDDFYLDGRLVYTRTRQQRGKQTTVSNNKIWIDDELVYDANDHIKQTGIKVIVIKNKIHIFEVIIFLKFILFV